MTLENTLGVFADPANRRNPAWWENGIATGKKGLTSTNALNHAIHLDFEVQKYPEGYEVSNGVFIKTPGKFIIAKVPSSPDDDYVKMANVTRDYSVIQNSQLAAAFEEITTKHPVINIGEFQSGKVFYMIIDAGTSEVSGDQIRDFFVVRNSHDGKSKTTMVYCPFRFFCKNQLTMALKTAQIRLDIPHKGENLRELKFGAKVLADMEVSMDKTRRIMEQMSTTKLKKKEIIEVIETAYKYPKKPSRAHLSETFSLDDLRSLEDASHFLEKSEKAAGKWNYQKGRVDVYRQTTQLLLKRFNDEFPKAANSAWAVANAIAENSDWRRGGQNHAESTLFSYRRKEKELGFGAAVKAAKIVLN
ncbi:MAG: DUF945 domain-containing protein [Ketobacter sp.]|nr:DUF945 domain-containing protein [Ketobacter sp.]